MVDEDDDEEGVVLNDTRFRNVAMVSLIFLIIAMLGLLWFGICKYWVAITTPMPGLYIESCHCLAGDRCSSSTYVLVE